MEATFNEFPFVEALPKREKSKLRKLWDELEAMRQMSAERGQLLPPSFAAELVGVSRQRIYELMDKGILERVFVNRRPFLTEASLREWLTTERRVGRPPNTAKTAGEMVKRSVRYAVGAVRGRK